MRNGNGKKEHTAEKQLNGNSLRRRGEREREGEEQKRCGEGRGGEEERNENVLAVADVPRIVISTLCESRKKRIIIII